MATQNPLIDVFEAYVDREDSTGTLKNSPDAVSDRPFYLTLHNQDPNHSNFYGRYSIFHTVATPQIDVDLLVQTVSVEQIAVSLTTGKIDKQTARAQIDALVRN